VVGLGAVNSPIGDVSGQVVYAMRLTRQKMTMKKYDQFCQQSLRGKIPRWESGDFIERVGDCIYDFSRDSAPRIRRSVHDERKVCAPLRTAIIEIINQADAPHNVH
jgi:hypothetical protein